MAERGTALTLGCAECCSTQLVTCGGTQGSTALHSRCQRDVVLDGIRRIYETERIVGLLND